jgi:Fe-S-cluster containining protein
VPNVRISLRVLDSQIVVDGPVPDGPARLDELLPFLRSMDDQVIGVAVRRTEASGEKVTCSKGCSTCCRAQPVPVAPVEAVALAKVVESMPAARRDEVKRKFAENVKRLEEAGLADTFRRRDPHLTNEQARDIAKRYFALGLVCPFLEDDACGIYADRPFVCRQYLVTSDPELCRDPFTNPVKVIPMPMGFAGATLRVTGDVVGKDQYTVPLTLALEIARRESERFETRIDLRVVLPRWIEAAAKGERE